MPAPSLPPIRGFEPLSLSAWEGRVAAVVRLQGCNFACPACAVPHLIPRTRTIGDGLPRDGAPRDDGSETGFGEPDGGSAARGRVERGSIPVESVLQAVHQRRRWLDAVVIGGGEPTIHDGLPGLAELFRELGLRVRVLTNGSDPDMLKRLLDAGDVSSVSMTVRAPLDPTYATAAGAKVRLASLYESVERILRDPGEHEFRVPWYPGLVEAKQVESILRMLAGARRVVLEPAPGGEPGVRALRRVARAGGRAVESCVIAGRPGEDFGSAALQAAERREELP